MKDQEGTGAKRAVLIVASQNFCDEELFETKRALDAAAVQTVIASTRIGIVRGDTWKYSRGKYSGGPIEG